MHSQQAMNKNLDIGKRLREERERLGFNQIDFAGIAGTIRGTQYNYESGKRSPDALYLAAIAAAGADVNYILTGHRAHLISEDSPGYTLRPDQKALLDNLEHCPKEDQDAIRRMALLCAGDRTDSEEKQKKNGTI
jgi:transcriptional regulator with XRE-family HTH domain